MSNFNSHITFYERVVVNVMTSPLKLTDQNELHEALLNYLDNKVNQIVQAYQISAEEFSSKDTMEHWTKALSEEFKIPLEVKTVYCDQTIGLYNQWRITFCIIMTPEIMYSYDNMHKNELLQLIDEMDDFE